MTIAMKIPFALTLLLMSVLAAVGQPTYSLRGRVIYAEDQSPLQGVTVLLTGTEGLMTGGMLTDARGTFRITNLKAGDYTLRIALPGFDSLKRSVVIEQADVDLGDLSLSEKSYQLDQVVIEGQEAIAEQKGDTVEYNASAFKANPDADAQDLIQKMPGVVLENGSIKAQGEQVEQVLVDGKPFFGNDPNAALQNLPADVIDKVQVLDQQSDQAQFTGFEDGETTKTINIITKPSKRVGQFGRGYAGYGYPEHRYQAGGSVNYFNGDQRTTVLAQSNNVNQQNFAQEDLLGIDGGGRRRRWGRRGGGDFLVFPQQGLITTHAAGLNFSDEWGDKLELTGSYFFNYSDRQNEEVINRTYLLEGDTGQVYREVSRSTRQNMNHRLNLRLEYKINEYNELRIRPRFTWQGNQGTSLDSGQTTLGDQVSNDFENLRRYDRQGMRFSNDITFQHKFNDAGRSISIELETDYDQDEGNQSLYSEVVYLSDLGASDTTDQTSVRGSNEWDIELEVEFNEPIGEWGRWELEYEYNPRVNDASSRTLAYNPTNERYDRLDTGLSNVFLNQYTRHELGTGLRVSLNEGKVVANMSVGYQTAYLDNEQVFPYELTTQTRFGGVVSRAFLRVKLSKDQNLRFFYRGSTDPPSVSQLQDVVDNSNPLRLEAGNPDLDQSYRHFGLLRYSSTNTKTSSTFYLFVRGWLTQNYVGSSTYIAEGDTRLVRGITLRPGGQLTLPVNLPQQMDFFGNMTYGRQLKKLKLNVNLDLFARYGRTPSLINERSNSSNNYSTGLGLTLSSNISEAIDFTVASRANVNQVINTLRSELNNRFYSQNSSAKVNLIFWKDFVFRSQVAHQWFTGLSDGFNQSFWLWNGSLGKKFFRKKQGELAISVFDALGQNASIERNVTSTYIEDVRSLVLQRYYLLTFTYKFRHFRGGKGPQFDEDDRRGGRGRW